MNSVIIGMFQERDILAVIPAPYLEGVDKSGVNSSRNPEGKNTGFPRIACGAGLVKPGMTNIRKDTSESL